MREVSLLNVLRALSTAPRIALADLVHRKGLAASVLWASMNRRISFRSFGHAGEHAAPKGTPLQLAELSLDGIEP